MLVWSQWRGCQCKWCFNYLSQLILWIMCPAAVSCGGWGGGIAALRITVWTFFSPPCFTVITHNWPWCTHGWNELSFIFCPSCACRFTLANISWPFIAWDWGHSASHDKHTGMIKNTISTHHLHLWGCTISVFLHFSWTLIFIIIIDCIYVALFSALEQTHCASMWFYMSE